MPNPLIFKNRFFIYQPESKEMDNNFINSMRQVLIDNFAGNHIEVSSIYGTWLLQVAEMPDATITVPEGFKEVELNSKRWRYWFCEQLDITTTLISKKPDIPANKYVEVIQILGDMAGLRAKTGHYPQVIWRGIRKTPAVFWHQMKSTLHLDLNNCFMHGNLMFEFQLTDFHKEF